MYENDKKGGGLGKYNWDGGAAECQMSLQRLPQLQKKGRGIPLPQFIFFF